VAAIGGFAAGGGSRPEGGRGRRLAVRAFVASIALNAALAIGVLLAGGFGETGVKILLTSLVVSAAALLSLACDAGREKGRLGPLPAAGMATSVAGFVLLVVAVWREFPDDWLLRLAWSLVVVAVATALVSVVSRAELAPRHRFAFVAAAALAGILAAMLVAAIWGQWDESWFWRFVGVVAVGLAAFTAVIPVLHRLSARERSVAAPKLAVAFCPSCGRPLEGAAGEESTCPGCGARFTVRFAATGED
jgi:hypothetical protein